MQCLECLKLLYNPYSLLKLILNLFKGAKLIRKAMACTRDVRKVGLCLLENWGNRMSRCTAVHLYLIIRGIWLSVSSCPVSGSHELQRQSRCIGNNNDNHDNNFVFTSVHIVYYTRTSNRECQLHFLCYQYQYQLVTKFGTVLENYKVQPLNNY